MHEVFPRSAPSPPRASAMSRAFLRSGPASPRRRPEDCECPTLSATADHGEGRRLDLLGTSRGRCDAQRRVRRPALEQGDRERQLLRANRTAVQGRSARNGWSTPRPAWARPPRRKVPRSPRRPRCRRPRPLPIHEKRGRRQVRHEAPGHDQLHGMLRAHARTLAAGGPQARDLRSSATLRAPASVEETLLALASRTRRRHAV